MSYYRSLRGYYHLNVRAAWRCLRGKPTVAFVTFTDSRLLVSKGTVFFGGVFDHTTIYDYEGNNDASA